MVILLHEVLAHFKHFAAHIAGYQLHRNSFVDALYTAPGVLDDRFRFGGRIQTEYKNLVFIYSSNSRKILQDAGPPVLNEKLWPAATASPATPFIFDLRRKLQLTPAGKSCSKS